MIAAPTSALVGYLQAIAANSESYFQQALAREDLAKVERLAELAASAPSLERLQHEALYLGWTPGDIRTGELKVQLLPLIAAMHAWVADPASGHADAELLQRWKEFHEARIRTLIHCL